MSSSEVLHSLFFQPSDVGRMALAQLVTSSPAHGHLVVHFQLLSAEGPSEWPSWTESKKSPVHPLAEQTREAG